MKSHEANAPFAAWISTIQKIKGWTPTEIARQARISPSTILRPLNNRNYKSAPSLATLKKIAAVAGVNVSPSLLMGVSDEAIDADRPLPQPEVSNIGPGADRLFRGVAVDVSGHIELPVDAAAAIGGLPGDVLIARVADGVLTIETVDNAVRRVHAVMRPYMREGVSAVDELIAERRAEAERE